MSILIADSFEANWFAKNPQYAPVQPAQEELQAVSTGMTVTYQGREYKQVGCLRSLTFLERAVRLIAAVAATILTGFIALIFENVRDLWQDALRGKIDQNVFFAVVTPQAAPQSVASQSSEQVEVAMMKNSFFDNFKLRMLCPNVAEMADIFCPIGREWLLGIEDGSTVNEAWLHEKIEMMDLEDDQLECCLWYSAIGGDSEMVSICMDRYFAESRGDLLAGLIYRAEKCAMQMRNRYEAWSDSASPRWQAQWANLERAIQKYQTVVADLSELAEERRRRYENDSGEWMSMSEESMSISN